MRVYQATALFSVLFALVGFSYNVWRMQASEQNSSVRDASFEMLLQLAELEQLVYAAHYDGDTSAGNPRMGWVKVGLVVDLAVTSSKDVQQSVAQLHSAWEANWQEMPTERVAADKVVEAIDGARLAVREGLISLD
ncbi:MAG: hypothetical protein ACI9JM_000254 [Halioglobus sp.]|jgi:hypothetical protein